MLCEYCQKEGRALGFEQDVVMPGASAKITIRPQIPFRGMRLYIPPSIAKNFNIEDIRVGYNSQMTSHAPIPAEAFSQEIEEEPMGRKFQFEKAPIGADVTLEIKNISGSPSEFSAVLFGSEVESVLPKRS